MPCRKGHRLREAEILAPVTHQCQALTPKLMHSPTALHRLPPEFLVLPPPPPSAGKGTQGQGLIGCLGSTFGLGLHLRGNWAWGKEFLRISERIQDTGTDGRVQDDSEQPSVWSSLLADSLLRRPPGRYGGCSRENSTSE